MYARHTPDDRYSNGIRIPSNYSGNAFRETNGTPPPVPAEDAAEESFDENTDATEASAPRREEGTDRAQALPVFNSGVGGLFKKGGGGIGLEELLILGLILLISQNDTKDDLAFLLMILLFIQ